MAEGYLAALGGGRHVAGARLLGLLHGLDEKQIIANVAAPLLHELAARVRSVVQLGTFENDMMTYRIKTGRGANALFTRVGMQLEAYCSGMGKVLMAHLPEAEREAYLASGPFVALGGRNARGHAAACYSQRAVVFGVSRGVSRSWLSKPSLRDGFQRHPMMTLQAVSLDRPGRVTEHRIMRRPLD